MTMQALERRLTRPAVIDHAESLDATASSVGVDARRVSTADWDLFAAGCAGISQEQLHAFARNRWPVAELEPIVFSDSTGIIGGALMSIARLPLGAGKLAFCRMGPVLQSETDSRATVRYRAMLQAIVEEYADRRGMMVSVSSPTLPGGAARCAAAQRALGFRPRPSFTYPDRYFVNLALADESQLKSLDQKWRYNLRKSFSKGLTFEAATSDRLDDFHVLYKAMSDRKRFPDDSPYDSVRSFIHDCPAGCEPRLFLVHQDARLVAGAIIFTLGHTAVYLYGATSSAALPLRAGYLMHWEIIRWLRANTSARWYDLGGTDGFQGLHQFKKGLVGQAGLIAPTPPVMTYAGNFRARLVGALAYAAHDRLYLVRQRVRCWRNGLAIPDQPVPERRR
jgi:hypothetical protein